MFECICDKRRSLAVGAWGIGPDVRHFYGSAMHGPITRHLHQQCSGDNWQINIDYEHGTVDSVPATISDAQIAWHTADGQHYRLDRKTGNLAVVLASSTGGSLSITTASWIADAAALPSA